MTWAVQSAADAAALEEAREMIAKQRQDLSILREVFERSKTQVWSLVSDDQSIVHHIRVRTHSLFLCRQGTVCEESRGRNASRERSRERISHRATL